MPATVEFELISPERILKSEPVEMVVIPGAEGDIGVLPGHSLLITTIRPGVIDIHKDGSVVEQIFISGGFAEVTPEHCTVLAEEAMPVSDINQEEAEKRLNDAKAMLAKAETENQGGRSIAYTEVNTAEALVSAITQT